MSDELVVTDPRRDLLDWCNQWFTSAKNYRIQSFESQWRNWQRNADAVYDPAKKAKKEPWQSTMFMGLTPAHRESIHAALFRTAVGPRPIIEIKPRADLGEPQDQSQNIRDMIAREMERTSFELEFNKILEDVTTYGSGFGRIYFHELKEKRAIRQPVYAPVELDSMAVVDGALPPQPQIAGWITDIQEVTVYRGVCFQALSIWDVFPDPKALSVKGYPIAYRFRETYDEISRKVEAGYYNPEALTRLRSEEPSEQDPQGKQTVKADRGISDQAPKRPDYGRVFELVELFARIPCSWALAPEQITGDPKALISARIIFHSDVVLAVEPSQEYSGESQLIKADYIPVNGQFYGRGIPEMLKDYQELLNETVNQRIDNVALVLNKGAAVIESAIVDPKDLNSKPGWVVRLDGTKVNDVNQAFRPIDMPDVTMSAYREAIEYERYAQERTSANRVTIGTAGQVKDANQTLGGMELLRQSANEKFAYIGMLQEFGFLTEVARRFWELLYMNLTPEDVVRALGEERAQTFMLQSPEDVEQNYFYSPQGIYTMENKALRQARLQAMDTQFINEPWLNRMAIFDRIAQGANEDPRHLKLSPEDMMTRMAAQANLQLAGQPIPDPAPEPSAKTPDKAVKRGK